MAAPRLKPQAFDDDLLGWRSVLGRALVQIGWLTASIATAIRFANADVYASGPSPLVDDRRLAVVLLFGLVLDLVATTLCACWRPRDLEAVEKSARWTSIYVVGLLVLGYRTLP